MKTDNPIVGVNLTQADKPLCAYVDFLSTRLPITSVNNFFVFTARGSFMALQKDTKYKDGKLLLELLEGEMTKKVTPYYKNIKTVNNQAVAGLFIESFYHKFNNTKTDLIFLGKDDRSYGTNAKFLVRHIPASTFIVPAKSKHKLDHILISIDHKEHSKKVLHEALDFCSQIQPSPKVTILHVLARPYIGEPENGIMEDYEYFSYEGMNMLLEALLKTEKKEFNEFVKQEIKNFPDLQIKVKVKLITESKAYYGVKDYMKHHSVDLVIMGTKSHSGFDSHLTGSLVEKMITVNRKVPMLVIR